MHPPLSLYNDLTMSKFKLSAPPIKTFIFDVYETTNEFEKFLIYRSDKASVGEEFGKKVADFKISIRQGTFGEDKVRSELLWTRKRIYEQGKDTSTEINSMTPQNLVETDLSIVICGISDLEAEGVETPEFDTSGSYGKPKSKEKMLAFLRSLPSQWIEEFYAAVLEVNPHWDLKSR